MKIALMLFLFAIAAEAADEGDFCTKEGVAGICTNLRECPSAQEDIKNRKQPKICVFEGLYPIVCCVPSAPVLTTTKRSQVSSTTEYIPPAYDYEEFGNKAGEACEPIHPSLTSKPTGQKAWDKCLEYQAKLVFPCGKSQALQGGLSRTNRCYHNADELIIGGDDAALHEFPHMALLGFGDDPANLEWLCAGSLISENYVLTAGHCIGSRSGPVSHVQLNTLRRSSMPLKNRYRVKRIIKHPQYAPPQQYNDIALLELETTVRLDDFMVPACLHTGAPVNDSRASVTGWGYTAYNGQTSNTLQKVILTKFNPQECGAAYSHNRLMKNGLDDSTQICFGDRTKSKDTCQGDSGGPLQIKNKQIACMYTLVGVTSAGSACGFVGVPGIYTRVAKYLDWIERTVWP